MIVYIMAAILFGTTTGLLVAVLIKIIEGIQALREEREDVAYLLVTLREIIARSNKGGALPS